MGAELVGFGLAFFYNHYLTAPKPLAAQSGIPETRVALFASFLFRWCTGGTLDGSLGDVSHSMVVVRLALLALLVASV